MMKKKIFLSLGVLLFLINMISMISAISIYVGGYALPQEQDECFNIPAVCENCTWMNITILFPDGEIAVDNQAMSNLTAEAYYYNYTFCNTSTLGNYIVIFHYNEDTWNDPTTDVDFFEITPTGRTAPTGGEGVIYIGTLLAMILFSAYFFALSFQFKPSKDAGKSEDGSYNPIPNDKPALRFGCLALSFIITFIILLYAMVSIQNVFYGFDMEGSYYIFMWIMGSIFIIIFIFVLVSLLIQAADSLRSGRGLKNV